LERNRPHCPEIVRNGHDGRRTSQSCAAWPCAPKSPVMLPLQVQPVARRESAPSVVEALLFYDCERDEPHVLIPRPEIHLAVRFGPSARGGLDAHALGGRERVHRKLVRAGQRTLMARLRLGAAERVLGVPASAIAGRVVSLENLWGEAATRRLLDQLADARDTISAAAIVESAIAERLALAATHPPHSRLALGAAERLTNANASVNAVAVDLGVSERHLRRLFRETVGVSPKTFAKLTRFRRALRAARADTGANWASIAVAVGYYDQAHLIAEFRSIAGMTPSALLGELRAADSRSPLASIGFHR
jgi:AraC-like DNA-binding protein